MQTFLPYDDYAKSARSLDRARLGKQRVENLQIMGTLLGCRFQDDKIVINKNRGWVNHPAVNMWRGYEFQFLLYQVAIVEEWEARGYEDTCLAKTARLYHFNGHVSYSGLPPWMGNPTLHISHQSNLIRKDPEHYGPQFPGVPDDLEYYWPV